MLTRPTTLQEYDQIARLERSRAFHAGIAWIIATLTPRFVLKARGALNAG